MNRKRVCSLCGGTGIIANVIEAGFFECGQWCRCDLGQELFSRVVKAMGKYELLDRVQAA